MRPRGDYIEPDLMRGWTIASVEQKQYDWPELVFTNGARVLIQSSDEYGTAYFLVASPSLA